MCREIPGVYGNIYTKNGGLLTRNCPLAYPDNPETKRNGKDEEVKGINATGWVLIVL